MGNKKHITAFIRDRNLRTPRWHIATSNHGFKYLCNAYHVLCEVDDSIADDVIRALDETDYDITEHSLSMIELKVENKTYVIERAEMNQVWEIMMYDEDKNTDEPIAMVGAVDKGWKGCSFALLHHIGFKVPFMLFDVIDPKK